MIHVFHLHTALLRLVSEVCEEICRFSDIQKQRMGWREQWDPCPGLCVCVCVCVCLCVCVRVLQACVSVETLSVFAHVCECVCVRALVKNL